MVGLAAGAGIAATIGVSTAGTPTTTVAACSSPKGVSALTHGRCPKGTKEVVLARIPTPARGAAGARGPQGKPGTVPTIPFDVRSPTGYERLTTAQLDGISVELECGDGRIGSSDADLQLAAQRGGDEFSYHAVEQRTDQQTLNGTQTTQTSQEANDGQDYYQAPEASVASAVLSQVSVTVQIAAFNGHELTLTAYIARDQRGGANPACTFVGALTDNGSPGPLSS